MELKHVNFGYYLKNIPTPSKRVYLKSMIRKLEHFIKRLRWKAFFHDHKAECNINDKVILIMSDKTPPQHDGLCAFEEDLYNMVKNIKFRNVRSNFQSRLTNDVTKINKSPNLFVPADKTNNLYKLSVDSYKKLLKENVTASYQKTATSTLDRINAEAISIAHNLKLEDRIESFPPRDAFITLRITKKTFCNHPKCRLINPAKSEIGKISKQLLDSINVSVRKQSGLNQ